MEREQAMREDIEITLLTRIGDLLEAYPSLEEVLVRYAPAFEKLRNPILRRTIARVATVQRAAAVAGVDPRDLLLELRRAAGQSDGLAVERRDAQGERATWPAPPHWMIDQEPNATFDADALLAAGEVPLTRVGQAARELPEGGVVRMTSTFRPEPLLEALEKQGLRVYLRQVASGGFEILVTAS
jgi:hypothetical protein